MSEPNPSAPTPVNVLEQNAMSAQQIKDMIDRLSQTEDGEPLKNAMQDLKKALLANPTACAILLPEDIGEMVKHLYKITGRDIEQQTNASKKSASTKAAKIDFTDPETLKRIEADLF